MNQSNLFYGSICVSDLLDQANKKHSGFTKGQNGKIYASINVWENQEPDKYGNTISIQLQSTKDKRDSEPKVYIGNAKKAEPLNKPIQDRDINNLSISADIPVGASKSDISPMDDLPF